MESRSEECFGLSIATFSSIFVGFVNFLFEVIFQKIGKRDGHENALKCVTVVAAVSSVFDAISGVMCRLELTSWRLGG